MPHLHLCNRAGFRDNATESGKLGHNRDIGPKSGTVPAKPGHLATMHNIMCICTRAYGCGFNVSALCDWFSDSDHSYYKCKPVNNNLKFCAGVKGVSDS